MRVKPSCYSDFCFMFGLSAFYFLYLGLCVHSSSYFGMCDLSCLSCVPSFCALACVPHHNWLSGMCAISDILDSFSYSYYATEFW